MTRHYKPNVVYVGIVRGLYYYVGCVCSSSTYLKEQSIRNCSGNPIKTAYRKGLITYQEYKENFEILYIEEFDTKEEARAREIELINEYKNRFPDLLVNKCLFGNAHSSLGFKWADEMKKKLSNRKQSTFSKDASIEYHRMKDSGEWNSNWYEFKTYYSQLIKKGVS